jgi:hypothetical protein
VTYQTYIHDDYSNNYHDEKNPLGKH